MIPSDHDIIRSVLEGDREAYRGLVDRYRDRMMGVVVRLTGDRTEAEDIAQEAFVKAYLRLDSFRGDASFGTWLVQIGVHLVRDRARKRQRQARDVPGGRIVSLEAYREQLTTELEPVALERSTDTLERLCREEYRDLVMEALERIPPDYREVLTLKHLESWSYDEIASVTGDSPGTLKVRAFRARQMLREQLLAVASAESAGSTELRDENSLARAPLEGNAHRAEGKDGS